MKRFSFLLFAGIACTLASHGQAQNWAPGTSVRIATEGAYKPWNFRNSDGTLSGFEIELVNVLCADLKYKCSLQPERWGAMLPDLENGKFDIVFAGMSITPARKTKATFTVPYATTPAVFVAAPGSRQPEGAAPHMTLPALSGTEETSLVALRKAFLNGTIGVQEGTTHEMFLRNYIQGYAQIRTFGDQQKLDRETRTGHLTAMLVGLGYAMPLVKRTGETALRIVGPQISGGPFGEGIGAAVRRGNNELAETFSAAIRERIADGTIARLSEKWFGFDVSAKP